MENEPNPIMKKCLYRQTIRNIGLTLLAMIGIVLIGFLFELGGNLADHFNEYRPSPNLSFFE